MSPVHTSSTFVRPRINLGYGEDSPRGVNSLPELIEFAAKHNPDHIFGLQTRSGGGPHREITFSQLQYAVERASAWLIDSGSTSVRTSREQVVRPVAIFRGSDISIFIYLAALLRIGTPVLILSARLTPVAIAHLLKETSPGTMLTSSQVASPSAEALSILGNDVIPKLVDAPGYEELLDPTPELRERKVPAKCTHYLYEDLNAFIMHSSGSTGLPKPIYHSQTYMLLFPSCHRFPRTDDAYRFNVSTLPLYHGFGLIAPSLSLSIGMPFVLAPAGMIPTAKYTIAVLQQTGARYLLSVPSIVEDILQLPDGAGLEALQKLEVVAVGGAPMKENVGCELVDAGVNLLNHWGCTEIGPLVPIQRVPKGHDWHYLLPRTDMDLKLVPVDDGAGTYRLIGRAPHWKEPHVNQDLLVVHPHDSKQFRIMGRIDDLLVLATGEKVRPTLLEQSVAEHPRIRDALAFGEGQESLGLLVEVMATAGDRGELDMERFLSSLEPFLNRGNSFIDKHGKVPKEMVIVTQKNVKPFVRTAKGNVARQATLGAFAGEIKACYANACMHDVLPFPHPGDENGEALLRSIRALVANVMGDKHTQMTSVSDGVDFFEAGMDSLQATRVRRAVLAASRVTKDLPQPVEDLPADFCYEHSSVEKLFRAVSQIIQGTYGSRFPEELKESKRVAAMEAMVERYREELAGFIHLVPQVRAEDMQNKSTSGLVVLLTGSTGSLGCFLLARLASDPAISKVICLNRPSPGFSGIYERQRTLMTSRGASMTEEAWAKVVLHEADMTKADFGLGKEEYNKLLSVTHIVHTAWPVNFNRSLSSFEPHVRVLVNLIWLSLLSARACLQPIPTRLLFASSIAVAGHYGELHPTEPLEVPEISLQPVDTLELGYAEAKWVCESVLRVAVEMYKDALPGGNPPLLGSIVRIGQMSGSESSGAWSENENIPIVVRTSQRLKALPILNGSLSWIPVNLAADAVSELLFSKAFKPFYHLENPCRQSWAATLDNLHSILSGSSEIMCSLPFPAWLRQARALGDDPEHNPALKLLDFLECYFERMATGPVVLDNTNAKIDSPTMANCTALNRKHLEQYVAYWRGVDMKK